MFVIPAIDVYRNRVARLHQGKFDRVTFYDTSPLAMAQRLEQEGFTHLHIVDLEGAKSGTTTLWKVVEEICSKTSLKTDVGGGIRNLDIALRWMQTGIDKINVGTALVKNPDFFDTLLLHIDAERIIFSADIWGHYILTNGWINESSCEITDAALNLKSKGLKYISCTDISRDGTMSGVNAAMYKTFIHKVPLNWIASGGIRDMQDIFRLEEAGCYGCITGRAIYEKKDFLKELSEYVKKKNHRLS